MHTQWLNILLWAGAGFLSGSLPFSYWVGKLALRTDIRQVGDGNPGMTNVLRAGGVKWGAIAMLLDYFKGAVPVGLAHFVGGITGWAVVPVALAPVLGHAYSPILRFKGGKAVAATFGIWSGLTAWEAPVLLGIALGTWTGVLSNSGWAVVFSLLCFLGPLIAGHRHQPYLFALWGGNLALLAWKYRADLLRKPELRGWIVRRLGRSQRE
jgi:glycerol-3-phosphate acyltransferase PlsY